jgi:uncharacterized protein
MENNPALYIGKVEAVRGRSVEINVHKSKNSPHLIFNGKIIKGVSVGSYVKICKGFQELIGKVDEEFITENKLISQKDYKQEKEKIKRILKLSLVGYLEGGNFKQGVKELPLLDNEAFLLEEDEFNAVHNFIKKFFDNDSKEVFDTPLKIGVLSNEKGLHVKIGVNSLFASHIGIFGNTGSGKSYTLASLYYHLFQKYGGNNEFKKNAKFLLIDFNGEYSKAITAENDKDVYELSTGKSGSTKKFPIKEEQIKDVEFWSILLEATKATQKPFLERAFDWDWRFQNNDKNEKKKIFEFDDSNIKETIEEILFLLIEKKIDRTEIIKFLSDCNQCFIQYPLNNTKNSLKEFLLGGGNIDYYVEKNPSCEACKKNKCYSNGQACFKTSLKEKINLDNINFKIDDLGKIRLGIVFKYYDELARKDLNSEHISPLLKRLKKIEDLDKIITIKRNPQTAEEGTEIQDNQKNLTIISLHDVKQDIKKVFPLLVANQYYSEKKKENNKEKYLNIIIDEAHNILSYDSKRESETWKDYRLETFEEIIKEGRKFGVFLTIASQRPSDISDTIISQLHNYFLHRLVNEKDILAIGRTVSYLDKISFESLPILPTGSCVLAGLSAQIPVIIDVDKIDEGFEPDNKTIIPTNYWGNPKIYKF